VIYPLIKSLHLLFVIAWMAAVFYLPRILVNLAEAANEPPVQARLQLMGRRLYKFGHTMFGIAFLFGLALWQGWRVFPAALPDVTAGMHWIDAKLTLAMRRLRAGGFSSSAMDRVGIRIVALPKVHDKGARSDDEPVIWAKLSA
jgi:uncharacterized membrane protein